MQNAMSRYAVGTPDQVRAYAESVQFNRGHLFRARAHAGGRSLNLVASSSLFDDPDALAKEGVQALYSVLREQVGKEYGHLGDALVEYIMREGDIEVHHWVHPAARRSNPFNAWLPETRETLDALPLNYRLSPIRRSA